MKPNKNGLFPVGKLPAAALKRQLGKIAHADARVLIGPLYGDDATVIDMGDRLLVCTCDPITLASARIGHYAVYVNANDVAVMGARPRWFWATILLPESTTGDARVDAVFSDLRAACATLGIELCGGHTEITAGLTRPIIAGCMAGEVSRAQFVDKKRMRPGDSIILVRGVAIEGTATIALEHAGKLAGIDPCIVRRARDLLLSPGIGIVREALLAVGSAEVHAMHDPTEGGIFTALRELAEAGGVGLDIDAAAIPVLPETAAVCDSLGLDPMGLLASGSLIVVCDGANTEKVLGAYRAEKVPATVIGTVREPAGRIMLTRGGTRIPLPEFKRDELATLT